MSGSLKRWSPKPGTSTRHPASGRHPTTWLPASPRVGNKAATACARKFAYQADPQGYLQRSRTERKHRRVGLRPHQTPWRF